MSLQLTITNAGLSAIAQAGTLGPVVISKVAIGSGSWTTPPTTSATALLTQIKQITPQGSSTPSPGVIHITAEDSSTDAYSVSEIGLYDSNNVLFAIAGGTAAYLTKYSASTALFSIDISLANVPVGTVTIGNANFTNPPATETTMGVAEIATTAEVTAGTDDTRIVTPKKLKDAFFDTLKLKEIYEEVIPYTYTNAGSFSNFWTSASFSKPAGEVWVFEFQMTHAGYRGYVYEFGIRYGNQPYATGNYLFVERFHDGQGGGAYTLNGFTGRFVIPATTIIATTLRLDLSTGNAFSIGQGALPSSGLPNATLAPSKLRIYKYKNA